MKDKKNLFKGKTFPLTGPIGQGTISFPGTVLESYGTICLVEEKPAYITGRFKQYGLYRAVKNTENNDCLIGLMYDFETRPNMPPRYIGTQIEVRAAYNKLTDKLRLQESEDELRKDRKLKEDLQFQEIESVRLANVVYIKARHIEIYQQLTELCKGLDVKKLATDKKVAALLNEDNLLESLKKFATR